VSVKSQGNLFLIANLYYDVVLIVLQVERERSLLYSQNQNRLVLPDRKIFLLPVTPGKRLTFFACAKESKQRNTPNAWIKIGDT